MAAPEIADLHDYLVDQDQGWDDASISAAYAAEIAAQARVCRVPTEGDYPADLTEALFRRVAHNLALRALPLGLQASMTDGAVAQTRVGGTDAEVRRLEAPFRKLVVG